MRVRKRYFTTARTAEQLIRRSADGFIEVHNRAGDCC
jgi:hypothetical protein